ncbi:MAG TPA: N-acetylmuramoyl-L-alanine amidase, partial [Hyphomicrobiaceae bacterium]|nr:N-acetylmuramoyl-L-alanine amidase [Hyphomicrobiaceae bacterium]
TAYPAFEATAQQPGGWTTDIAPAPGGPPAGRQPGDVPSSEAPVPAGPSTERQTLYRPGSAGAELSGDENRTRLLLELTSESPVTGFSLSSPWRVVVDLPGTEVAQPLQGAHLKRGLVSGVRAGLFAAGKLRVVLDTTGPVSIETARILSAAPQTGPRLEIVLTKASASSVHQRAADLAAAAQTLDIKLGQSPAGEPEQPRKPKSKPVVVVDPGHGGIDPGAQGALGVEKDIVLAVAREIERVLRAGNRYEVIMTRSTDVFVSLAQRVQISRQHHADLFLSLHADSLDSPALAQKVSGATVYTLSDRATDARAQRVADKENAADLLAGLQASAGDDDGHVRDILLDLMKRETADFSNQFRKLLVGHMRPRLALVKDPFRSAPFRVLRQPGSPAVLIELGYMSNAADEKLMATQAWQRGVADSVAAAVTAYFNAHRATQR